MKTHLLTAILFSAMAAFATSAMATNAKAPAAPVAAAKNAATPKHVAGQKWTADDVNSFCSTRWKNDAKKQEKCSTAHQKKIGAAKTEKEVTYLNDPSKVAKKAKKNGKKAGKKDATKEAK